jgi:hypothetical protein
MSYRPGYESQGIETGPVKVRVAATLPSPWMLKSSTAIKAVPFHQPAAEVMMKGGTLVSDFTLRLGHQCGGLAAATAAALANSLHGRDIHAMIQVRYRAPHDHGAYLNPDQKRNGLRAGQSFEANPSSPKKFVMRSICISMFRSITRKS